MVVQDDRAGPPDGHGGEPHVFRGDAALLDGLDALLSMVQMPPGIPVATVGVNGAQNAAILAVQILAQSDAALSERLAAYKERLKEKVVKANEELAAIEYAYKV